MFKNLMTSFCTNSYRIGISCTKIINMYRFKVVYSYFISVELQLVPDP